MKKFLALFIIIFVFQSVLNAVEPVNFNIIFNKQGKSGVVVCDAILGNEDQVVDVNENAPKTKIEFPIYNNDPNQSYPSTSFGIVWNVYSGSLYTLSVSAHATDNNTSEMLVAEENGQKDYLGYTIQINPISGDMTENKSFSGVGPHEFFNGTRAAYTLVTGKAGVTLTIDKRNSYLGDYTGVLTFTLTTDS